MARVEAKKLGSLIRDPHQRPPRTRAGGLTRPPFRNRSTSDSDKLTPLETAHRIPETHPRLANSASVPRQPNPASLDLVHHIGPRRSTRNILRSSPHCRRISPLRRRRKVKPLCYQNPPSLRLVHRRAGVPGQRGTTTLPPSSPRGRILAFGYLPCCWPKAPCCRWIPPSPHPRKRIRRTCHRNYPRYKKIRTETRKKTSRTLLT